MKNINGKLDRKRWKVLDKPGYFAGVMTPLFSLRSEKNLGCGEIPDLKLLIKWCQITKQSLIQLLPLNDTGMDSSPYSAISSKAINPVYISLDEIRGKNIIEPELEHYRELFRSEVRFNYKSVRNVKINLLSKIFSSQRNYLKKSKSFAKFRAINQWLKSYSAFCVLKELYEQHWWREWPEKYRHGTKEVIQGVSLRYSEQCFFHQFIQWELEKQLMKVKKAAEKSKILLKGDIPILMSDDSADVWTFPDFFDFSLKAGAPPDMFSDKGQNWGFPTYRWDVLKNDKYAWWIERLKQSEKFYHAIRIDHVLGFFRIWSVPKNEITARLGVFIPSVKITKRALNNLGIKGALLKQLSMPIISKDELQDLFGANWQFLIGGLFVWNKKGKYYTFSPSIKGEKDFEYLNDDNPELFDEVSKLWAKRVFITLGKKSKQYFFKWAFEETAQFQKLPELLRAKILKFNEDYEKKQNVLWKKNGRTLMNMILNNTKLLVCAEDLGYVPPVVRPVLQELGILSLKVDRWERDYNAFPSSFIDPKLHPFLSVCTPSVHDTSTLRGWWEESLADREQYFQSLDLPGPVPDYLTTEVAEAVIKRLLSAGSAFTVFAIQDWFSLIYDLRTYSTLDERVNIPGTISEQNWSWRMKITIEELLKMKDFNKKIAKLIKDANRAPKVDLS